MNGSNGSLETISCIRLLIKGAVQGVGFRPFVYRLAVELKLNGNVRNSPGGVVVEIEGTTGQTAEFIRRCETEAPPNASIHSISRLEFDPVGYDHFEIIESESDGFRTALILPDIATCKDCINDITNAADRRHGYPFTNCTNCGPRFSIIEGIPYDRPKTSMKKFDMCDRCSDEYGNVEDRRFHAQPNACAKCGPGITFLHTDGQETREAPLACAAEQLRCGRIMAIKGLGGYHLCCDATNDDAIDRLRARKNRPAKALAVMFRDIAEIELDCILSDAERKELESPACPITVLHAKEGGKLSPLIAPDTNDIGAFLPYTPLHHLLLSKISPLVMTSGNLADEPIVSDERELSRILGPIADAAVVHDRPIARKCDDSVLRVFGSQRLFIRRSRGYVPSCIKLPMSGPVVLGCGAELKNSFCLTRDNMAFVSQHIGDLSDHKSYEFFKREIEDLSTLFDLAPTVVAHDLHPDYLSTRYALENDFENTVAVQHHHAHIAACMAEHGLLDKVIGVAFDGMGLGDDGTLWGGEFLVADLVGYERIRHLKKYAQPGGDQATASPERMALSYLLTESDYATAKRLLPGIDENELATLCQMITNGFRSPLTSSAGRLFDAVSAMLGVCRRTSYEGQAAIRLQAVANRRVTELYDFNLDGEALDFGPMIREIVLDIADGTGIDRISAMFHNTVAAGIGEACESIAAERNMKQVILSGGVFQNEFLLGLASERLRQQGFEVYSHFLLPPNDACIAMGQAAVALARTT